MGSSGTAVVCACTSLSPVAGLNSTVDHSRQNAAISAKGGTVPTVKQRRTESELIAEQMSPGLTCQSRYKRMGFVSDFNFHYRWNSQHFLRTWQPVRGQWLDLAYGLIEVLGHGKARPGAPS